MAKSIFITGASSGLGEAVAIEFARRGYAIAIAARRVERIQALADRLRKEGAAAVLPVALDVTDFARIEALAKKLGGEAIDLLDAIEQEIREMLDILDSDTHLSVGA